MKPYLLFALMGPVIAASQSTLGLRDVLEQIDRRHPKLLATQQEVAATRGKLREKQGAFDPVFRANSDLLRYNSSSSPGNAARTTMSEAAIEVNTPSGISYFAGSRLNLGKAKSPAVSTGDLGEYFAGIKLPILRDLRVNEKSIALRQAELAVPVSEGNLASLRLETLRSGAGAYWEWVASARRAKVATNLLALAQTRQGQVRQRVQEGEEAEFAAIEAGLEVERRRGGVAKAERDAEKAALKLALYLWGNSDEPSLIPQPSQAPQEFPGVVQISPEEERDLQAKAAQVRPEIRVIELARRSLELSLDLARNARRPALDLVIGPGLDLGTGGIGPTWKAGLFYSVPLRQNTADGRAEEATAKLRKLELDRRYLIQSLRTEVADAASAARQAYLKVEAAQRELDLARRLQLGEQVLFEEGSGTLFLLNRREREAAEAAQRLIDVTAEYHTARADLAAAAGAL